jgi:hypothetical protein
MQASFAMLRTADGANTPVAVAVHQVRYVRPTSTFAGTTAACLIVFDDGQHSIAVDGTLEAVLKALTQV